MDFPKLLKDKQLRLTKTRLALLGKLAEHETPVSADQLWGTFGKKIDRVTVYRELAVLAEHSLIRELSLGKRAKQYELASGDHNHHLVCLMCGSIDRVAMAGDLDKHEKAIARTKQFQVVRHALEFFGYCAKCQA